MDESQKRDDGGRKSGTKGNPLCGSVYRSHKNRQNHDLTLEVRREVTGGSDSRGPCPFCHKIGHTEIHIERSGSSLVGCCKPREKRSCAVAFRLDLGIGSPRAFPLWKVRELRL